MQTIAFSGPFTLDRSRHAAVQVYEFLRDEIVNLILKPGTLLSRNELAAHFALSVTHIRDALMRLEVPVDAVGVTAAANHLVTDGSLSLIHISEPTRPY